LVVTSLYCHAVPMNMFWWALQICSTTLMTSLGIWACRWRELRPISFGGRGASTTAGGTEAQDVEEVGQSRGRGRGRGRDGAGEYEMVGMGQAEGQS
jgi:ABC-type nickel/cobalt efflux system permease component RcnA